MTRITNAFCSTTIAAGILMTFSYTQADVANNLIAHYTFDNTSGDVIDSTGNYPGTNNGATRGVTGLIGNAFRFDGVSNYIDTVPQSAFPISGTVSVWIKPTHISRNGSQVFGTVNTIQTGQHGLVMNYYEEDSLAGDGSQHSLQEGVVAAFYHDEGRVLSPRYSVPLNLWTHLAYTYDSSINEVKIYTNGQLSVSGSFDSPLLSHNHSLMFGRSIATQSGYGFSGLMDDARVYDAVLSDTDIADLYGSYSLYGDLNGDGFIGIADLNILLGNWNAGTPPASTTPSIPEPTSIIVLGLASAYAVQRRNV